MITRAERRRALCPSTEAITAIAAEAYAAAARSNAPMRRAVEIIEPLRDRARSVDDAYALKDHVDAAVVQVVGDPLLPVVRGLRDEVLVAIVGRLATLVEAAGEGTESANAVWVVAFAEALGEYRGDVCKELAGNGEFSTVDSGLRSAGAVAAGHLRLGEWAELRPGLESLLQQDALGEVERAPLLAMASLIDLLILDDPSSAGRLAHEARESNPAEVRAAEALALGLWFQNRRSKAEAVLREVLERDPTSAVAHSTLARIARESGELADAEEHARTGLRDAPWCSELYNELIQLYSTPELFSDRETRLPLLSAQARELDPDPYSIDVDLACCYRDNDRADRAIKLLLNSIAAEPSRPRAYVELAGVHVREKNFDEARRQLDRAVELDPSCVEAVNLYAKISDELGNHEDAIDWTRRELDLTVGSRGPVVARLAVRQLAAGAAEESWRTACEAATIGPNDVLVLDTLQDLVDRRWRSDPDSVRMFYSTYLDLADGEPTDLYFNMIGNTARAVADVASAIDWFNRAVEKNPSDAAYHRNLARSLRDAGRWDESRAALDRAYTVDGDEQKLRTELALVSNGRANESYRLGDYEAAAAGYREAIEFAPDDAVLHGNLALALIEDMPDGAHAARLEDVVSALTRAAELDPDSDYDIRSSRSQARLDRIRRFGELIDVSTDVRPVIVEFADDLVPRVDSTQGSDVIGMQIPMMREQLEQVLGFAVPGLLLRGAALAPSTYRILLFGVPRIAGRTPAHRECVLSDLGALVERGLSAEDGVQVVDPVTGGPLVWADADDLDGINLDGLERLTDVGAILRHVGAVIRSDSGLFLGLDAAAWLLDQQNGDVEPSRPLRGSEKRAAQSRQVALSRTLRACTNDGINLDHRVFELAEKVAGSAGDSGSDPLGADSVRRIREALADRLPQGLEIDVAPWVDEILRSGRRLSVTEEHELLSWLEPLATADPNVILVTATETARPYLQRLLQDAFGRVVGVHVNVLTEREVRAMRAARTPTEVPPRSAT